MEGDSDSDYKKGKHTYKYALNGNIMEDNLYTQTTWNSYTGGDLLNFSPAWELDSKITYKHDDKKNIIEKTEFSAKGAVIEKQIYKYEYDNVGNWIKCTDFTEDKPLITTIKIREIEYY